MTEPRSTMNMNRWFACATVVLTLGFAFAFAVAAVDPVAAAGQATTSSSVAPPGHASGIEGVILASPRTAPSAQGSTSQGTSPGGGAGRSGTSPQGRQA